ncbi:hypothetical protein BDZ89DRAFT_1145347 [Hymenopellis radicata]|nr:hypothetical protein BDZ89DRAFT_1145347 [Hymenopellis radicata]
MARRSSRKSSSLRFLSLSAVAGMADSEVAALPFSPFRVLMTGLGGIQPTRGTSAPHFRALETYEDKPQMCPLRQATGMSATSADIQSARPASNPSSTRTGSLYDMDYATMHWPWNTSTVRTWGGGGWFLNIPWFGREFGRIACGQLASQAGRDGASRHHMGYCTKALASSSSYLSYHSTRPRYLLSPINATPSVGYSAHHPVPTFQSLYDRLTLSLQELEAIDLSPHPDAVMRNQIAHCNGEALHLSLIEQIRVLERRLETACLHLTAERDAHKETSDALAAATAANSAQYAEAVETVRVMRVNSPYLERALADARAYSSKLEERLKKAAYVPHPFSSRQMALTTADIPPPKSKRDTSACDESRSNCQWSV